MDEGDITEKKILEYLRKRRVELLGELNKIDLAIQAMDHQLPEDFGSHDRMNSPMIRNINGISTLQGKVLSPMDEYNPDEKLDNKVAYALTKQGEASKKQICDLICTMEPDLDKNKLERSLSVRLSFLVTNHLIQGKKLGRSYIYRLN